MKDFRFMPIVLLALFLITGCSAQPTASGSKQQTNKVVTTNNVFALQNSSSPSNNSDSKLEEKLNKVKELEELQRQKTFMLAIAQDDLEHYMWGETSQYPDIWKQMCLDYNLYGNRMMSALRSDLDFYIDTGSSQYELIWSAADLTYELYKTGKLKEKMSEQQYNQFIDDMNAIKKRLGVLYAKREYIPK